MGLNNRQHDQEFRPGKEDPVRRSILAATTAAVLVLFAGPAMADVYLSPSGSDSSPCTKSEPCRTMERGETAASSGGTVVDGTWHLRSAGPYTTLSKPGVAYSGILRRHPPILHGKFKLSGSRVRLRLVEVRADRERPWERWLRRPPRRVRPRPHGGRRHPCQSLRCPRLVWKCRDIRLGDPSGIKIDHNFIHDNGGFGVCGTRYENGQHGIYWSSGSGLITENKIVHNWTRGVQLYSSQTASRSSITRSSGTGGRA